MLKLALFALFVAPAHAQDEAAAEGTEEAAAEEPVETATTYALSGTLYVVVKKDEDTFASALSHNHAVKANGWSGSVTWHPSDAGECKVEISVPVASLIVDDNATRSLAGLGEGPSDSDRQTIKENMLAADQLNGSKFPSVTFSSTSCSGTSGNVTVKGNMGLRGATKAISPSLAVTADGSTFTAKGSFQVNHTDFGFEPFSALFGQLKNSNQLTFHVDVSGTAK